MVVELSVPALVVLPAPACAMAAVVPEAGYGSVGSSMYCAVPVTQARPVMVGTTAGCSPTEVSWTRRPMKIEPMKRLVHEVRVQCELAAGVQLRHASAGAGPAG